MSENLIKSFLEGGVVEEDGWMSKSANEDEILFANEWLSVRETPGGYTYVHQEKSNGAGVAVLAYRWDAKHTPKGWRGGNLEIVGRFEECPPHRDGLALTSLTGMLEEGEDPLNTAVRELWEEAGIQVSPGDMKPLGTVKPSKASDTVMHLFSVDVGEALLGKGVGDGTRGEANAYCRWVSRQAAIDSKDALLSVMILRSTL